MTILKVKIDNLEYEVECKKGEEGLLEEAESLINEKIDEFPEIKKLPQSKKTFMLSLLIASDLLSCRKELKISSSNFLKIEEELSKLEGSLYSKIKSG